jgi:hypothetical protein
MASAMTWTSVTDHRFVFLNNQKDGADARKRERRRSVVLNYVTYECRINAHGWKEGLPLNLELNALAIPPSPNR